MIQRRKHLFYKNLRFTNFYKNRWEYRVVKTFKKNFLTVPLNRVGLFITKQKITNNHFFYKSQNKLQCMFHFNFSVPAKRIGVSRFFFNKNVETLTYGNSKKKN